jgi:hypothetical protein
MGIVFEGTLAGNALQYSSYMQLEVTLSFPAARWSYSSIVNQATCFRECSINSILVIRQLMSQALVMITLVVP